MYKNLRDYIARLDRAGELVRVKAKANPVEEIAEITDRVCKSRDGGKAVLFETTGTDFPVVMNLMGSDRRIAMALGVESLGDIAARIDELAGKALSPKHSLTEKMQLLPLLAKASKWMPKNVSGRGECQQVVLKGADARLSLLPILKIWPHDGGRFVTLPLVHTVDAETGARNVGMYRMQVLDDYTTGMHWHIHKTGAKHYEQYKRLGKRMPVSVCIGGDPVYTYAATAPLPDGIDEYLLAGFLRGRVRLVKCVTNDIRVPADCDFVIEGYVDPQEDKFIEGPFGDHTGFYSLEDLYPKFHVTAITHRRDAIYPATIVGVPPQEDVYFAKATEHIFLSPIRFVMHPEIRDMYMPPAGVAHNLAIINIRQSYPGQAHKVIAGLWGAGQMMFEKYMIVLDADIDIRNRDNLAGLLRAADIGKAVIRGEGVLDILDHATADPGFGGKLALDLTGVDPDKAPELKIPVTPEICGGFSSADCRWAGEFSLLVLHAGMGVQADIDLFFTRNQIEGIRYCLVADSESADMSLDEILWFSLGNSDPRRDATVKHGALIIDGRTKPASVEGAPGRFPNVVASSQQIIELVDRRWHEYGFSEFIESPSVRYRRLLKSGKAQIE